MLAKLAHHVFAAVTRAGRHRSGADFFTIDRTFASQRFFAAGCALLAVSACTVDGPLEEPDDSEPVIAADSAQTIDVADYVVPNCAAGEAAWQIGSEQFRIVPMGVSGGRGRLAIVKSSNGDGYEEWWLDSQWVRISADTTWAFEAGPGGPWCDVKCGENHGGNCQQRRNTDASHPHNGLNPSSPWAFTRYVDPADASLGAPWIPRYLSLPMGASQQFTTHMEIHGARRDNCGSCGVNFATGPGHSVPRTVVAHRYASWQGFADVLFLDVVGGPGMGERYYYARGLGWIGFNNKVASHQVSSSALPQSSCASFVQGSICSVTGGTATPPPEPPPPPPPPPGGCECRTDVDNYCLYGASYPGCNMTAPGGYCDPNGDGDFADADWVKGYNEYHAQCP